MSKAQKEIMACDKTHVDFHKTFASIFSAYSPSILRILSYKQTGGQNGYKVGRFLSYLK